ncbi:hypothetical protein CSC12_0621 [Klebsiella michiganensis]|nr:hypothetical protein CSC12_0621 [Klebsiella michiganensis]
MWVQSIRGISPAGLQVFSHLRTGSPDRCAASPPGKRDILPGAALDAPCPG